jgi:hypothetical protein
MLGSSRVATQLAATQKGSALRVRYLKERDSDVKVLTRRAVIQEDRRWLKSQPRIQSRVTSYVVDEMKPDQDCL